MELSDVERRVFGQEVAEEAIDKLSKYLENVARHLQDPNDIWKMKDRSKVLYQIIRTSEEILRLVSVGKFENIDRFVKEVLSGDSDESRRLLELLRKLATSTSFDEDLFDFDMDILSVNYLPQEVLDELHELISPTIDSFARWHANFYGVDVSKLTDNFFLLDESEVGVDDNGVEIRNPYTVYKQKYALKDDSGELLDKSVYGTFARVAFTVALASLLSLTIKRIKETGETDFVRDYAEMWAQFSLYYTIMGYGLAVGAGRIMANAGTAVFKPQTTLINCTVMKQIPDSMKGIMDILHDAALTLKSGAGVGYAFSTVRPKGTFVHGAGASTSGVLSFMDIYDTMCQTIESAGGRRGAQMGTLHVAHPEIEDYIVAKQTPGRLRMFNLSVLATDSFMEAVQNDGEWDLWFWEKYGTYDSIFFEGDRAFVEIDGKTEEVAIIRDGYTPYDFPNYDYFVFAENHQEWKYGNAKNKVFKKRIYKTVKARELYDKIMESTYEFGEPGVIFYDKMNEYNPINKFENLIATNPCFVGDTRISTSTGLVKIEDLAKSGKPFDIVVDNRAPKGGNGKPYGDLGTSIKTALRAFPTGKKPIRRLVTYEGYELVLTPCHKLLTTDGYTEVQNLIEGDKILIQSGSGKFGTNTRLPIEEISTRSELQLPIELDEQLAEVFGLWLGDGYISSDLQKSVLTISTYDLPDLTRHIEFIQKSFGSTSTREDKESNTIQLVFSSRVSKYLLALGLGGKEHEKRLPEFLFTAPKNIVAAFIRGYFAADGSVQFYDKESRVSLHFSSSNKRMLQDIQLLLLNFGIYSRIRLSRNAGSTQLPNGSSEYVEYNTKDQYELIIESQSVKIFGEEIGFLLSKHQTRYDEYMKTHSFYKNSTKYYATVKEIIDEGFADVYDLTEPETHSLVANGFVAHNCGEVTLPPSGSCLLGSLYLHRFVENPFKKNARFDWATFVFVSYVWNEFLDNVNLITGLPLAGLRREAYIKRRHGLGFTALADAMAALGIRYGDNEKSVEFTETITSTMEYISIISANTDLAEKYGDAPIVQLYPDLPKEMYRSKYIQRLIKEGKYKKNLKEMVTEFTFRVRFTHTLSIAPTGTISFTFGNNVANGIEPAYAISALRNIIVPGKKTKQMVPSNYFIGKWYKNHTGVDLANTPVDKWPKWAVTVSSGLLTVDDHIKVQESVQKFSSQAISKTVNIPPDYSFDDFKDLYIDAWKKGLKGVTSFKFNPAFSIGVLTPKEIISRMTVTFYTEDGEAVEVPALAEVEYDGEVHIAANLFEALKEGTYGKY